MSKAALPLLKWLMAVDMLSSARKGIPTTQMAREPWITQKSAWFPVQPIRETWLKIHSGENNAMGDHIQVDEA